MLFYEKTTLPTPTQFPLAITIKQVLRETVISACRDLWKYHCINRSQATTILNNHYKKILREAFKNSSCILYYDKKEKKHIQLQLQEYHFKQNNIQNPPYLEFRYRKNALLKEDAECWNTPRKSIDKWLKSIRLEICKERLLEDVAYSNFSCFSAIELLCK